MSFQFVIAIMVIVVSFFVLPPQCSLPSSKCVTGKTWKNNLNKKKMFSLDHKNWYQSTVLEPIIMEGTRT